MSNYIDLNYISKIQNLDYNNLKRNEITSLILDVQSVNDSKKSKTNQDHICIV